MRGRAAEPESERAAGQRPRARAGRLRGTAYLGFSRDRLYKLTAARAIPFRKKREGQALLFHRDELDRWLEAEYESTGCAA